jgi:hypothetical protein
MSCHHQVCTQVSAAAVQFTHLSYDAAAYITAIQQLLLCVALLLLLLPLCVLLLLMNELLHFRLCLATSRCATPRQL